MKSLKEAEERDNAVQHYNLNHRRGAAQYASKFSTRSVGGELKATAALVYKKHRTFSLS